MKIKSATYIKGITGPDEILYDGKFQMAFMGRSNVGKSTLINSLTMRKNLARPSSTPGKTIRMDFFLINDSFYLVDFPGYGYSKHSFQTRENLAQMMLSYLKNPEIKNKLVLLIIDAKVGITPLDAFMLNTFHENQINYLIIANKVDNLGTVQREKQMYKLQQENQNTEVIPYSSKQKKQGFKLLNIISSYIK